MPEFDFRPLALALAGISLGLIGAIMAAAAFFPDLAERYKKQIPTVILGLVLVAVAGFIIQAVGGK